MPKKRNKQPSSCPDGWDAAGIVIPLRLNKRQDEYAKRCVGIARAVQNTLVATHQLARNHLGGLWPSPMDLERVFNEIKHDENFGMTFTTEVSKFVAQGAARDFRSAYNRWRDPEIRSARPTFQKKNVNGTGAFLAASGTARIKYDGHRRITLPYIGSVKLKRELPEGTPYEATIRRHLGQWELSINYWRPPAKAEAKTHSAGGVDVGISPLAVDSDMFHYPNPKALYRYLRQLARWQRAQKRRHQGSRGWREAQSRINSLWRRIMGIRNNAHHQISRLLVRKYQVLAIESLNVAGMDKLRFQAKAIRDAAIGNLLHQIKYKSHWYGTLVVEAARSFPSSKTCSNCRFINTELEREPRWICPECHTEHERNENAALNLLGLALEAVMARFDELAMLGTVGPDVTLHDRKVAANGGNARRDTYLSDRKALTHSGNAGRETSLDDRRTARTTPATPGVDEASTGNPGAQLWMEWNTQLVLGL